MAKSNNTIDPPKQNHIFSPLMRPEKAAEILKKIGFE